MCCQLWVRVDRSCSNVLALERYMLWRLEKKSLWGERSELRLLKFPIFPRSWLILARAKWRATLLPYHAALRTFQFQEVVYMEYWSKNPVRVWPIYLHNSNNNKHPRGVLKSINCHNPMGVSKTHTHTQRIPARSSVWPKSGKCLCWN